MTHAAHTPGPWTVGPSGMTVVADGEKVADTCAMTSARWPDARLIAAAPDLLAALRTTLEWLPYDQQCRGSYVVDHMECPGCAARAAIRKATGAC